MFEEQFYNRLIQLRQEKGVSAREMSLAIGQSESYINRIENRKNLPSLMGFFYICDYFGITPGEFFGTGEPMSMELMDAVEKLNRMDESKRAHVIAIIDDLAPPSYP